ncbi:MAG: PEGA domain-containing protein [Nitrospiraceae bacterium]|nr:PEGA domain-containing protein [Nitrospiraceae bacterium]
MKIPSNLIKILILITPMLILGCATIVVGDKQSLTFDSEPAGAQIIINGKPEGVTPATITIKKSDYQNATVVFKKEGYTDQQATLHTKTTGWFWGNILIGGLFGSTTDSSTGAMLEYEPAKFFVTMPPAKASLNEMARLDYQNRVRAYILFSHQHLVSDLAKGSGEHLSSLYVLLGLTEARQQGALRELRTLAAISDNAPAFAEAVLKILPNG